LGVIEIEVSNAGAIVEFETAVSVCEEEGFSVLEGVSLDDVRELNAIGLATL
jgi:hypothetical protein